MRHFLQRNDKQRDRAAEVDFIKVKHIIYFHIYIFIFLKVWFSIIARLQLSILLSFLNILETDSQACPSWLWGTCCGSKDGWYTPGWRWVTDNLRNTISWHALKSFLQKCGAGSKLSMIWFVFLGAWEFAITDLHALPPDPVADHLLPEEAGRQRGLGLPILLDVHI